MLDDLRNKLLEYIRDNNPDVLFQLEQEAGLTLYLNQKLSSISSLMESLKAAGQPQYVIEQACMEQVTEDLRPSKYSYICNLLSEDYEDEYHRLCESGLIQFEGVNLVIYCQAVFEDLKFSEATQDNRFIRYAICGMISEYFESKGVKENVGDGLQQPAETEGQH